MAHSHRYIEHMPCYFKEKPDDGPVVERIGFLDIEATNLHATFGYAFSYCIKELDGPIFGRVLTPEEIRRCIFDKKLIEQLCKEIRQFDRIIVYWGKDNRYDIPFIRTRAVYHGCDFPVYKDLIVNDLYDIVKRKLRLHRNRLETACEFFDIPSKEHRLSPRVWQKAMAGDKKSLEWILDHNREDVISTEALWKKLEIYVRNPNTSI
jgi:uncharacterized protein YprB with RNaseH-like and TPR domain